MGTFPTIIDTTLFTLHKSINSSTILQQDFNALAKEHFNCAPFYTDEAKFKDKCGCAVVQQNMIIARYSLPSDFSIFSVEHYVIKLAINILHSCKNNNIVTYTNSFSLLSAIKNARNSRSHLFV